MTSQMMTTEQLRTQRKPDDVEASFNTYRGFQAMSHMAESLANSTIIPEAFRNTIMVKDRYDNNAKKWLYKPEHNPNGVSNCIIALNMAQRLGADPMMIMQNLYLVDGRPSWSSQFIIAAINSCGRYSPLRFDITGGDEEMEIPYAVTEWEYNKETRKREPVDSNKVARVKNLKCVAWVIEKATGERLESSPITMELAVKEGWFQKNGSKWQTMPEQMLRYRAASFFGRIYAPDLLMGLRTHEEELDSIIDITPEPAPQDEPTTLANIQKNVVKNVATNDQISTSNDVEEKNVSAKKPTSTEVRKEYLDRIAQIGNAKDLETVIPFINGNEILTDAHKTYLVNAVTNKIEDLNKSKSTNETVDPNRSAQVKGGLAMMINEAKTLPELEAVAPKVTENKAKLTPEDHQELLVKYSERKVIVAQVDIFDSQPEQKPVEKAIARIMKCQTQDEINQVWAEIESDPYLSRSLTEEDKKAIESAADQREAEITG
ncbi:hypothetical protein [Acinetobacter sp. Ver3]|uniref:hypothetical protein n=1 Tax=Acinetobacter sp. Ver3 TaxID=466088 RepID=UPI0004477D73|nr:hypothetical protein [Acinetobacter sp. Ver3]EZQ12098.1 hypothetical protein CL42_02100 [Acinetobacter sp. Ver3]